METEKQYLKAINTFNFLDEDGERTITDDEINDLISRCMKLMTSIYGDVYQENGIWFKGKKYHSFHTKEEDEWIQRKINDLTQLRDCM